MSVLPKPKRVKIRASKASGKPRLYNAIRPDYARIDYDTRQLVWKRDGGECRHCGSKVDLQFDHIVPKSRGGSGLAANVELLCAPCNSKKRARLAPPSGIGGR